MADPVDVPKADLRSVLDQLGALVLRHDAAPPHDAAPVTGVVIDDRAFGAPLSTGCAVLAVGTGDDADVAALVTRAAAAGAVAVFAKRAPGAAPLAPGPVPLVEVAPDLGWEQLHAFVRTAILRVGGQRPGGPQTLFDVANAIAVLVDGAVVIEDEHLRVVAYSSLDHQIDEARQATILGRQIPERFVAEISAAGVTSHLDSSTDPVRVDLSGPSLLPRLAISLRSGGRPVGLLWAITDDEREPAARRVLADAAPDVAAELVRYLTADASRATERLTAAQQVLEGRPVPRLRALLGAEPTAGVVVLALQPVDLPDLPAGPAPGEPDPIGRTAQFATVYLDAYRVPALVAAPTGDVVEVIVGLDDHTPASRARQLLDELVERTRATFGIAVRGAMGAPAADGRGVPGSRRDAAAVLEVLAAEEPGAATASYDEVQSRVALRELARRVEGAEHLGRGPLPALLASAARPDAALVDTVRSYLAAGGDVGRAAADLDVHRNTVRYRLGRFGEVTGLDLDDPATRLVVQVQLLRPPAG